MSQNPHKASLHTGIAPAFIEPERWEALHCADNVQEYAREWLALLCASIAGCECGVLVLRSSPDAAYAPLAVWPPDADLEPPLTQAADASLQANQGLYRKTDESTGQLAHPVRDIDGVRGVVALRLRGSDPSPLAMRLLQWGLNGLQLALLRHDLATGHNQRLRPLLETLTLVLQQHSLKSAADTLTVRLASLLDCRRVALGMREGHGHRLLSLSHSAGFSEKTQLARSLEAAMDESGDLARQVMFSPGSETHDQLYPAHARLTSGHGGNQILSLPFGNRERILGCLVLERPRTFDDATADLAEAAMSLSGPVLELQRDREEGVIARARSRLGQRFGWSSSGLRWKILPLMLLLLAGVVLLVDGRFRISADALVEASIQQAVVAPMDGFIDRAPHRAGDRIESASLLFRLDDVDLRLEQAKLEQQLRQLHEKYRNALAQRERAEIGLLKSQIEQARAQLDLTNRQLQRTRGLAPFDGVIVAGDLSQKQGAPVKRGEVLFEVAPLEDFQLMLQVDERDIAEIHPGQSGELVLASAANASLPLRIERITPMSETREGQNFFRVEAQLIDAAPERLQPGMKGIAKIDVGERKLGWIWSREMLNWLRLWLWSWLP